MRSPAPRLERRAADEHPLLRLLFDSIIADGLTFCSRARSDMYLLYSLLFTLGLIVTAPYYLWRHRGSRSFAALRERFGFLPTSFRQAQQGAVWVHAVSVGETLAVARVIEELHARYPGRRIFLSHVTPAGREAGEKRIPSVAGRFFLPFDWAWCVRRVVRILRPAVLLIVETELWPNLLRVASRNGCRVALLNARLSDRSFPRYLWIRGMMRRVLAQADCLCVQSSADAARFEKLGASPDKLVLTGNLKFDVQPPQRSDLVLQLREALDSARREPLLIAASTMPNEEDLVIEAWKELQTHFEKALMILAPRHPGRFNEVAALLERSTISFVRRSSLAAGDEERARQIEAAQVLLLDSIGELSAVFQLADLVYIGGTLVPTGGHNPLEPAFWGKAIVFGPHMENFRDLAEMFVSAGAAAQVTAASELGRTFASLLENRARCERLGENARKLLEAQSGATRRSLDCITEWLEPGAAARVAS